MFKGPVFRFGWLWYLVFVQWERGSIRYPGFPSRTVNWTAFMNSGPRTLKGWDIHSIMLCCTYHYANLDFTVYCSWLHKNFTFDSTHLQSAWHLLQTKPSPTIMGVGDLLFDYFMSPALSTLTPTSSFTHASVVLHSLLQWSNQIPHYLFIQYPIQHECLQLLYTYYRKKELQVLQVTGMSLSLLCYKLANICVKSYITSQHTKGVLQDYIHNKHYLFLPIIIDSRIFDK